MQLPGTKTFCTIFIKLFLVRCYTVCFLTTLSNICIALIQLDDEAYAFFYNAVVLLSFKLCFHSSCIRLFIVSLVFLKKIIGTPSGSPVDQAASSSIPYLMSRVWT